MTLPDFLKMQGFDTSKIEQPKEEPAKPKTKPKPKNPADVGGFLKNVAVKDDASCRFKEGVSNDYTWENTQWVRVGILWNAGKSQRDAKTKLKGRNANSNAKEWAEKYREGDVVSGVGGPEYDDDDELNNAFYVGDDPSVMVRICLVKRITPPKDPANNWAYTVYARYDYDRDAPRTTGPKGRTWAKWRGHRIAARDNVECPYCKRPAGDDCISPRTGSKVKVHYERVRKYIIEKEGSDAWFENYESERFTKKGDKE